MPLLNQGPASQLCGPVKTCIYCRHDYVPLNQVYTKNRLSGTAGILGPFFPLEPGAAATEGGSGLPGSKVLYE